MPPKPGAPKATAVKPTPSTAKPPAKPVGEVKATPAKVATPAPAKPSQSEAVAKQSESEGKKRKWGQDWQQQVWQQQMMMLQQMMWGGGGETKSWKTQLHETLKKNAASMPVYSSEEREGGGGFIGTATIDGTPYTAQEPAKSKKEAEQNGAKAAMESLYPDAFAAASAEAAGGMFMMGFPMMGGGGKGQKRQKGPPVDENPKSKLMNGIHLFVQKNAGRVANKTDVVFTTTEVSEGPPKTYQTSIVIAEYEGGRSIVGEIVDSKKGAELSAAKAAYDEMESILTPLMEEHQAKKKQRNQETLAMLKKKDAEKKEAKKVEKAAAQAQN